MKMLISLLWVVLMTACNDTPAGIINMDCHGDNLAEIGKLKELYHWRLQWRWAERGCCTLQFRR